jgi:beta-lactamase superfamily II metal-dependent hydrolase
MAKTENKPAERAQAAPDPIVALGSPSQFRARVRMYRQGLGDCFLITFPGKESTFNLLIDCGALARGKADMIPIVAHIRDTILDGKEGIAKLDLVVATHEHRDHLNGFNLARDVFDNDLQIDAVWMGWTENLTKEEISTIKKARKKAKDALHAAINSALAPSLAEVASLLGFIDDDAPGSGTIAEALEYLKTRGKKAGNLKYLEPGAGPFELPGVEDVRVFVLGPPRDPLLLKGSEVTGQMKRDDVVYHLSGTGEVGMDSLSAAISAASAAVAAAASDETDRYHPFSAEHRIPRNVPNPLNRKTLTPNPWFKGIQHYVDTTYDNREQAWRRIDEDWLHAFGQLALDLDNDTNNTSLVLAFEFVKTREVLLFVGDAQVGNWQSWGQVHFKVPETDKPLSAHDLLSRTCFYKVGHHCSHNATLRKGGLELMNRDDLVAFIPLDIETAKKQGKKDPKTGNPKGWDMPAAPLLKALKERTNERVVISDVKENLTPAAQNAGVIATDTYIDYFLK